MKIAIINDLLGGGSNGTFLVTFNLLDHLKRCGHEVKVICADESRRNDPDYAVLPARRFGPLVSHYLAKVGVCVPKCSKRAVAKLLDGVEHVHCITPFRLAQYATDIANQKGIPVTAGFHAMAENITAYLGVYKFAALNRLIYRRMYKRLYGKVNAVHYPTEFIKNHFWCETGKNTPAYVISNGVNAIFCRRPIEKPAEWKGKTVITTVGRYSREKAQEVLIKAVGCSNNRENIMLILAGHGMREKYYRRLARKLGVHVVLKTYGRDEMVELLNCTDIYVHPAVVELEGIACLEALRCGLPIVTSDSPLSATYDFASNENCVFESGDFRMLARIIDKLIDFPELRLAATNDSLSKPVPDTETCMRQMDGLFEGSRRTSQRTIINECDAVKMV